MIIAKIQLIIMASFFTLYLLKQANNSYQIQKGDTLWDLAKRMNTSVEALQVANPGLNPKALQIGQKLVLPSQPRPSIPQPQKNVSRGPTAIPTAPGSQVTQSLGLPQDVKDIWLPFLQSHENRNKKGYDPKTNTWKVYEDQGKVNPDGTRGAVGYGLRVSKPIGTPIPDKEVQELLLKKMQESYRITAKAYPDMLNFPPHWQATLADVTYNTGKPLVKNLTAALREGNYDRALKEYETYYYEDENKNKVYLKERNKGRQELFEQGRRLKYQNN